MISSNIVDLIVQLARKVVLGEKLVDIKSDHFNQYKPAEISAAYSWIENRYQTGSNATRTVKPESHRVLHYAEKILITSEAYGYLIELSELGVLDQAGMEAIIEKIMFNSTDRISLDKLKSMVQEQLFDASYYSLIKTNTLKGNESVH